MGEGGPVAIPPAEKIDIGADGTISIRPIGGAENELAVIDRIKLVKPDLQNVFKDQDGLLRMSDGTEAPLDATVKVASGTIEGSNVNAVGALMSTAEENSAASARLLQLNG
jgi:flagellar basal-body rod protein FlgF